MKRRTLVIALAAALCLAALAFAHGGSAEGLTVVSVMPSSAAAAAGVMPGDRLLQLDGQEVGTLDALRKLMAAHQPGDSVPLAVERNGEEIGLTLVFGELPGGGVSIGLNLEAGGAAGEPDEGTEICLSWIDDTYQVGSLIRDLHLDLAADYETVRACVARDSRALGREKAVKFCDNVFKIHCSGLDLLTEIGESQVQECEDLLGKSRVEDEAWKTCARDEIFDRYSIKGQTTHGEAACRAVLDACAAKNASASWTQWGGPNRDFRAPAEGLATSWSEGGPRRLWSRPLGDGYSAVVFEDGRLYTLYRVDEEEAVIALDAKTGETLWEHRYEQAPNGKHVRQFGDGPNSTPLLAGGLLFSVGIDGKMLALKKGDGKVVWSHDLWEEFGGNVLIHGYSSSPVAYEDSVIVPVGGEGAGFVAFDQQSGRVKWKATDLHNSYSSPSIVELAGETELLAFMAEEIVGVDPDDGVLRWRYPHANPWKHNTSLPAVVDGDTVFLSSPQAGARGLRLTANGERVVVEEIWSTRRVQLYHVTAVRIGDWVYGSTGTATAFLTATNVRTGEIAWRERGFAKANCVEADGKLVILDEDGMLYLARATPEELVVLAKTQLLEPVAWTVPTIVGKTLYARDRKRILAVDLG